MSKRISKKVSFSPWDPADHLRSEEDIIAYLQACLEEAPDDATFLAAALGDVARARGMMQLARDTGLSREGLYKALSSEGNPSLETVLKVLRALGLRITVTAAA
ncbi:MAG: putative addiction module antidote protein [Steroidobacteraceae bacterium]